MENLVKLTPENEQLIVEAGTMLEYFKNYRVVNQEGYTSAAFELKKIKDKTKIIEEARKAITKPLDEAKKKAMDLFRDPLELLTRAEKFVKKAILDFQQRQEKVRREQEAKLREQQRKEAERLQKRAEKAESKGQEEKAEELKQQAEEKQAINPTVAPTFEKTKGISTKKIWKFKIVDIKSIPREYMMPDEKAIGQIVRATKGTLQIPGVEIYSEETIAA